MKKISIVSHSGYGHTAVAAEGIRKGIEQHGGIKVSIITVKDISENEQLWQELDSSDAIIFGSPTYMGSVSADFKKFMDASSKVWAKQGWKDKFAAGFTNSAGLSGDKLNTLVQMSIFAAQHSMLWISCGIFPTGTQPESINRIGSWLGYMSQSDHDKGPDVAPSTGDRVFAEEFGKRIAKVVTERTK